MENSNGTQQKAMGDPIENKGEPNMNEGGQSKHKRGLIGNKEESDRKRTGPPEANEGSTIHIKQRGPQ